MQNVRRGSISPPSDHPQNDQRLVVKAVVLALKLLHFSKNGIGHLLGRLAGVTC